MNLTAFMVIGGLVQVGCAAANVPAQLAGCEPPGVIAGAIEATLAREASTWSREQLVGTWPGVLVERDCASSVGTCSFLVREGRVVDGSCECCETLELSSTDQVDVVESLSSITVYYSAEEFEVVQEGARRLARALGYPGDLEAVLAEQPLGGPAMNTFDWEIPERNELRVLDVAVSKEDVVWTAYLALGWYEVGSPQESRR